jgi:hypothetical protein
MNDERMALTELLQKSSDGDFLRSVAEAVLQILMEMVDALGLLLRVAVHPANVQDRDGAGDLLRTARRSFPVIERIFADADYQRPRMAKVVARTGSWTLQIVKRIDAHRFVVFPNAGSTSAPLPG